MLKSRCLKKNEPHEFFNLFFSSAVLKFLLKPISKIATFLQRVFGHVFGNILWLLCKFELARAWGNVLVTLLLRKMAHESDNEDAFDDSEARHYFSLEVKMVSERHCFRAV